MLIDCHNHSKASMDSDCPVSEMLFAAEQKKISVFAITDHCELDEYEIQNTKANIRESVLTINSLKNTTDVKLLCGIEIGQANAFPDLLEEVLNDNPFDMVIGSLHCVKNEKDFYYTDFDNIEINRIKELINRYFDELYELCEMNFFDTLAHITYPFRYIKNEQKQAELKPFSAFDDVAKKIFSVLIKNEKSLEYNTSSTRRSNEDFLLNKHFMELYYNEGGRLVTIGSDAHSPTNVGSDILQGMSVLKEIGFTNVTYYENRKAIYSMLQIIILNNYFRLREDNKNG